MAIQSQARTQVRAQNQARARVQAAVRNQARARSQATARNRAQARRQARAARRERRQTRLRRSNVFQQFASRKLEAAIFIAVLAVAIGGLYFAYFGTGQAIKRLPACTGGYIIPQMSFTGLEANYYHKYKFRGLEGEIELVDIKGPGARFSVDGVLTPYLELTNVWLGEKIGIKVGDISRNAVSICLAATTPECIDYYWDLDTKRKECGKWTTQAESLF